ncbi:hypothetical protein CesoFtcFv8_000783 [Champsocephalus esox]|uniref:MYND-type domain-containing protein n=1 Tax=Champsocephalus esox TaxID=159716 RepID=A0AAN8D2B5_9TELE|nr:hypothetical protein CesoFtcFv8_000783 [Champsocephalus esox]
MSGGRSLSSEEVVLGFLEEVEPWRLLAPQFPSKVGGRPAWLSRTGLPGLQCEMCRLPMAFLLQVYGPISGQDRSFHRTLFLFCCKTHECYTHNDSRCFKVFRSQVSRRNEFYPYNPPPEDEPPSDPEPDPNVLSVSGVKLCWVCGCPGNKACSRCHSVTYCGKPHQTLHWKHTHKRECGSQEAPIVTTSTFLFPESELVTEPEEEEEEEEEEEDEDTKESKEEEEKQGADSLADALAETDLEEMAMHETERQQNGAAVQKEDCTRATPGGARIFEFQVMPQLLNSLCVDSTGASIDWGTLAVYACSASCNNDDQYCPEFIWKQDFSSDRLTQTQPS